MAILKLRAPGKNYIWGGRRLIEEYNKSSEEDILAETWELSCYPGSSSIIENGEFIGKTLNDFITTKGKSVLGLNCKNFDFFPLLIKFIDAKDNLSIQVHPSDDYALKNEGQYGKTEMWYVIDAEPGAYLYYGFKKEISKEEMKDRIENNTLLEVLNKVNVNKGDVFFIEAGTLHAIGSGLLIAEIQQNSNVTYRVYDYGRRDKNGKTRDLHIEKALDVTNRFPPKTVSRSALHLAECKYFTVDKICLDGRITDTIKGKVSYDTFLHLLILDGEGTVINGADTLKYNKGDSFFIPSGSGDYELRGRCEALITYEGKES